jgi:hypothetical protein
VEVKAAEKILPIHEAQLVTYSNGKRREIRAPESAALDNAKPPPYAVRTEGTGTFSTLSTNSALTSNDDRVPKSFRCAASHTSAVL